MEKTLETFFEEEIPRNVHRYQEHLGTLNAVVFFDVQGEQGWRLELLNSQFKVEKVNECSDDNCRISATRKVFEEILNGKRKILSSLMFGKVKFKGDMKLAQQIGNIIQGKS